MSKTKIILICIFVVMIVSLLTYLNYDKIISYFNNKEWEIADLVGKIELNDNYLVAEGTSSNFVFVGNSAIEGYSSNAKKNFEKSKTLKDVITYAEGDFLIIGEKDPANIIVICGDDISWEKAINNANILSVYINKNGYSAVVYSQSGYKSLIKVFSNNGTELFTNYLASTYAIDVAISNDNKALAIAEIDTDGINVESNIKLVDIKNVSENNIKNYSLDNNEVIADIEYNENNNLYIMTDSNVKLLKNNEIKSIVDFKNDNILSADISNKKNVVTVKVENNGLFSSKYLLSVYSEGDMKSYELEDAPNSVCCMKNVIAIDMGNEIIFLNSSANFMKKCQYNGQLKDIKLFNNGNTAVLVFRDTANFIKVGGI